MSKNTNDYIQLIRWLLSKHRKYIFLVGNMQLNYDFPIRKKHRLEEKIILAQRRVDGHILLKRASNLCLHKKLFL